MNLVVNKAAKVLRLTPILPVLMLLLVDQHSYLELGIFLIGVYSSGCVIGYLYNAVATAYMRSPNDEPMAARDVFVAIYKDLWDKEDCVYWELARIWLNLVAAGIHAAPWFSRKPYTDLKWYFIIAVLSTVNAVLSTVNLGIARLLALLS